MLKLSQKKRKACLALAVAAAVLGANNAFAASVEHDKAIYESNNYGSSMRTYWQEQGVYDADKHAYTFNEDISLKPKASEQDLNYWTPIFGGLYVAGYNPVTIDMQGHRLDIAQNVDQVRVGSVNNIKAVSANGIHVTSSSLTLNNVKGMDISVGGSFLSTGKVRGIYVAGTNQEGAYGDGKGLASLTINNADGWENAITFKSSSAQVENAIEVKKNTGTADLSISGMVDLYVGNDSDVITVSGGKSYYDINSTPTAYIGGGAIKAAMGRAALVSGGVLSINSKLQNGELVATEGNRDVQIEGNFLVKDLQEDHGVLTIGMNTDKSYFKGTIFNENGSGDAYMLLQNAAQWTNASKGGYDYHGSSLKQFVGGNSAASTGYIYQNDKATLNLGKYSGYTTIFYEHSNAGTETSDYTAGNTIVDTAKAGSNITLITNNVDTNNDATVNAALNALAGKLYYNAAQRGDNALEGTAVIADGLTSSSKALKTAGIYFNEETCQGTTTAVSQNTKRDFTTTLTGVKANDSEYADAGIIAEDGSYTFAKNSTVTTEGEALNSSQTNITILTKNDSSLSLASKGQGSVLASTLNIQNKGNVSITASELKVAMDASESTAGITSGIQIGTMDTYLSRGNNVLTVKGDTTIDVTGKKAVMGIYSMTDSETVFEGNLKIKVNNTTADKDATGILGHYHTNGIYAGFNDSTVTVKGDVDITVNGTGIQANKGGKVNVIGGGSVKIDRTDKADQYALEAEAAEITMNVATDTEGTVTGAGNSKVVLEGNLGVLDKSYGAAPNNDGISVISLGLATEDSTWRGVAYNEYRENEAQAEAVQGNDTKDGKINLYLKQGTWINEAYGAVKEGFTGSKLHILAGGNDVADAGNIFQNDSNKLTIDNYSGNTNIYYAHTGNGEATANYVAGDTIIRHAEKDSVVSLITDNTGVAMDNADSVANVLNALAGKLTYSNFTKDENNLAGYVKIADGLTASSATKKTGDITFNKGDGKGTYIKKEVVEKSEFTTAMTGNKTKDEEYEGNIDSTGKYTFSKDSTITLTSPEDNAGAITAERDLTVEATKDLKLKVNGSNQNSYGLVQDAGKNVVINAENLNIDVSNNKGRTDAIHVNGNSNGERGSLTINGDLNMNATHDISAGVGGAYTLGAYTYQADIVINGNVTSAIDAGDGVNAYYGASHLYASGATGEQKEGYKGGTLTVNGNVDLSGTAQGLFANIGGAVVTVNGGGKIILDANAAKSNGYAAIRAENSTANMNVKLDAAGNATGGLGNDVVIKGNVTSSVGAVNSIDKNGTMTRVNLALDTENSSLQGAIVNGFDREDGTTGIDTEADEGGTLSKHFTGENNLWLQNGATWINELYGKLKFFNDDKYKVPFQGSHVTNFTGGSDAAHSGYIIQNDRRALTIDNYSGNTNIFYAHTGNGEATDDYAAGDTIIKHAEKDAAVTLITDNTGVNLDSDDSVTNVLNALAGKLYYNAYVNNERNLAGTVSIADGLTASSFTKTYNSSDITFNDKTGQGSYVKAEAPVQTEFTTQLQGFAARDTEYINAGITTGDQKYTFTKDSTITVGNKDAILGVAEIPADWVTTFEKTFKGVTVDAGENTLTLKTNQRAIYANGNSKPNITSNITAGKLLITANETSAYRDAAFAVATGGVTLNINADIEGTVYGTNSASYGLYAEKGSKLTVNGDITAVKENGYGIDGKTVSKNYGIRANDGTITVNGGVNMTVNGKAIAADKGTVNVNMNADLDGAADNAVILQGDVTASNGTVNLGLNTEASKLTGAVNGNVNLYLANGASWDNTGAASNVAKLAGGTSAAGNIFANSTNAMTIDSYSGNTNIYYAHTGNGEAAENYAAGDTIIKSAAEGSVVSMITDNNGIKMDSEDSVANVLNALAGKLTYSNFTKGEKNLAGYVKIADGLTASSAALKTENITFNSENGKGGYVKPEKPVQTEFTTQLQGFAARDTEYVNAGITTGDQKYTFKKDSSITVGNKDAILGVAEIPADWVTTFEKTFKGVTVDAGENTLTLKTNQRAIYANGNSKPNITSNITAGKLLITANETSAYRDAAFAVATGGATLNINADIEGTVYGTNSASYGLYAEKGSKLTVNGDITAVKKNGYGIDGKTVNKNYGIRVNDGTITVNGGVNMIVNGKAIAADKGTVNVNMNADLSGAADHTVILQGDVTASNGTVNLGLNTQSSKLTGAVSGNVNLYLANGASWDNTGAASSVAKLAGGASKAGNIFANSTNAMTIDSYSGNTNIYYAHTGNGEAAENYAAGDTIIRSAAEGSVVSMITDNSGIAMDNEYSVANVLNTLAGKLTYSNFTKGEKNLAGYVKIADGLTASSAAMQTGNIAFNADTGKGSLENGSLKPGFTYPETQKPESTEKNQGITGDGKTDYEYKKDGILKEDGTYVFTQDPTKIEVESGAAVEATENNINIDSTQAKLELKGETGIKANGADVNVKGNTEISGNVGIDAANGNVTLNGSTTINANDGKGTAINAGEGGNVDINTNNSALNIKGDINANGGNITLDSGKATGTIEGNVNASNGGNVEISLNDKNSTITGSYNVDADSSIVMNIANGATWNLTDDEDDAAGMSLLRMAKAPAAAKGLTVNGGQTQEKTGYLNMTKRTKNLKIDHYSGWETVIYGHENAGDKVSDYKSGNTIIDKAETGSGLILYTDNTGVIMDDKKAVEAALAALAQKVQYNDHEANGGNLTGKVKIAEGMTAAGKIGSMRWDENGKGQYVDNSVNWKEIYNGNYETFVMKGVRSAATTSMHSWRDNMQDTYTGADLADADGIFAKALGGKTSSDVKSVKDDNTYRGVQVGLDKALANGWHAGVAFDYRNGDSNYLLGGKGDNQLYSLGVYGVKNFADQSYLRVAAKAGRVENEYDVYNETRRLKLHGDYKSNAYGLTMEYGKTFGSEASYFTPKAQLTWSQVGAKDYTAHTPNDSMRIDQDAYSSLVARFGVEAGAKSEKGRVYVGLYGAHEFNGDITASYFAKDGGYKHTSFDGSDTWMEMSIGGSYDLSDNCHIYADFAKDFGGDFERKWKASAGLRFEF